MFQSDFFLLQNIVSIIEELHKIKYEYTVSSYTCAEWDYTLILVINLTEKEELKDVN